MVQIGTRPKLHEQIARAAGATAERAQQELASSEFDPGALSSRVRRALAGSEAERCVQAEAARDEERLKAALLAGVVLFGLSAIVFLVAREIARRRQRRATTTLRPPLTPRGMTVVEDLAEEGETSH